MFRSRLVRLFPIFATLSLCAALARPAAACGPYVEAPTPEEQASAVVAQRLARIPAAVRPVLKAIWTDGELAVARIEKPKNRGSELLVLRNVDGAFRVVRTVPAR